jgi:hypothetical protein
MKRDRTLYIVELPNGNWVEITRVEGDARAAYDHWKPFDPILLRINVPEAQDTVSTH